jgi:hypothetical protein
MEDEAIEAITLLRSSFPPHCSCLAEKKIAITLRVKVTKLSYHVRQTADCRRLCYLLGYWPGTLEL